MKHYETSDWLREAIANSPNITYGNGCSLSRATTIDILTRALTTYKTMRDLTIGEIEGQEIAGEIVSGRSGRNYDSVVIAICTDYLRLLNEITLTNTTPVDLPVAIAKYWNAATNLSRRSHYHYHGNEYEKEFAQYYLATHKPPIEAVKVGDRCTWGATENPLTVLCIHNTTAWYKYDSGGYGYALVSNLTPIAQ